MNNITCESAKMIYEMRGDKKLPVKDIELKNIHVGCIADSVNRVENIENIITENITYDSINNSLKVTPIKEVLPVAR